MGSGKQTFKVALEHAQLAQLAQFTFWIWRIKACKVPVILFR